MLSTWSFLLLRGAEAAFVYLLLLLYVFLIDTTAARDLTEKLFLFPLLSILMLYLLMLYLFTSYIWTVFVGGSLLKLEPALLNALAPIVQLLLVLLLIAAFGELQIARNPKFFACIVLGVGAVAAFNYWSVRLLS